MCFLPNDERVTTGRKTGFWQCDGLAYWLHANDQFLVSLYAVAAEGIDREHRRRVHEMKKTGREEIFGRIYEGAGLPAPSI